MKTILHHKSYFYLYKYGKNSRLKMLIFISRKGKISQYKVIQLIENNHTIEQTHNTLVYINNRHYIYHHRVKAVGFMMNAAQEFQCLCSNPSCTTLHDVPKVIIILTCPVFLSTLLPFSQDYGVGGFLIMSAMFYILRNCYSKQLNYLCVCVHTHACVHACLPTNIRYI